MNKTELTGPELHELRDVIANVPKKAKPTLTETSTPLSVREPDNKSAEFGPIRPTQEPKKTPSYPDTKKTPIKPNTKPHGQPRAFKASTGKN
jgi:hypothetical protein